MRFGCSRRPWPRSGGRGGCTGAASGAALWIAVSLIFAACAGTTDPWTDPEGVQLSLFGDRMCSDPVFGQAAEHCCLGWVDANGVQHLGHDNAYEAGGTEQDRALADAEFLACQLLWNVPPEVAELRWWAVRRFGAPSFRYLTHRTRGPPR